MAKKFKKPSDIKVGVIGYGGAFNMGRTHLKEMRKAGMTPVAVCDLDEERLVVAEEEFPGIATYVKYKEMLKKEDINLITIITPHDSHAQIALDCLRAGKSVCCEKPLALTTNECDRMTAAAKKNGVILSTYHNRHWDGCIMHALKKIRSGVIGDVFRIEAHMGGYRKPKDWWRSSKSISGGILYDWGVHLLEYSLQILDAEIVEVSGFSKTGFWSKQTKWKKDGIEDEGFAVVRLSGDKWLTLCITMIDSKPKEGQLEITGTKGTYIMEGRKWTTITHEDGRPVTTTSENPKGESWRFYQNIADNLTKGKKLIITPEWSRRPIHILDLACKSAEKGHALKAKYH